jgi:C2 domain
MPIYLALETRLQMEVWFVMLKCYASPELYGPPSLSPAETFRCQRSLSLRIMEGRKLHRSDGTVDSTREKELDTYCEILIEGEIRGKTSVKKGTLRPLWTEDFEFLYPPVARLSNVSDLPDHVDDVSILLRYIRRNRDLVLGKVSLSILDTEMGITNQKWHPLAHTARDGLSVEYVGELDLKYKLEELVILTSDDYSEIRKVCYFPLRC